MTEENQYVTRKEFLAVFDELTVSIANGFSGLDERFERIDKKFEIIEDKLNGLQNQIIGVNSRMDDMSLNYIRRDEQNKLEKRVKRLEVKLSP